MDDMDVLARTIFGEARGELYGGKVAVANVVMNRVAADLWFDRKPDWWGEGVAGVCLAPSQFSCWNEGDPNRTRVQDAGVEDPSFGECMTVAARALAGTLPDVTLGATHYHTSDVQPSWARGHVPVIRVGRHVFYNTIENGGLK